MPIYEYHCLECNKDVEIFFFSLSEANELQSSCPECGSRDRLERVFSNVSVMHRKVASQTPEASKNSPGLEDSKSLANVMKKASQKSRGGYGDDFKEVAARLDEGETATSIEKSMRKRVGETIGTH